MTKAEIHLSRHADLFNQTEPLIGALIGTSLSAAVVLASAQKSTGLTFRDLFVALASWLIWITLCASLFINNTAAILISGILLLGAAAMQLRSLQHGNENTLVY